jgi:hypothetical protein
MEELTVSGVGQELTFVLVEGDEAIGDEVSAVPDFEDMGKYLYVLPEMDVREVGLQQYW